MKIINNGFYNISEILEYEIFIGENINVVIFDNKDINRKIKIGKNSRLEIYGYLNNSFGYKREIIIDGENSKVKLGYLFLSGNKEKIKAKIYGKIKANFVDVNFDIISIAGNNAKIDIDGVLDIVENIKDISGKLDEKNLFLGDTGVINSIPSLFVGTRDVRASHSCKIEKISNEELFYLRSKGINKQNSIQMMLESYISNLFGCLKMFNQEFYTELIQIINNKINNLK